ncbi:MAG: tetratricopeptide repeat protein [Desulfonatronovibrio sp.]
MHEKKINRFSRRDLFKGFMRHVRGQDMEEEGSGLSPEVCRADQLLREKQYREAADIFAVCLQEEPGHVEALRKLGYCQLKLDQLAQARQTWEKLTTIKPGDHFAVLYTGLSHAMENDADRAVAVWKKYFNIKQPFIQREINLILALHERGDALDPAQMVKSVEEAIAAQKKK